MGSILERKFTKVWHTMKSSAAFKGSAAFKKADTAVCKKFDAYQKALAKAKSGLVDDLLKLGKALRDLEETFLKFVDVEHLAEDGDADGKKIEKATIAEINRLKAEVRHERSMFDSRLMTALSAADQDLKKLESAEAGKKKELWKGFGIEL